MDLISIVIFVVIGIFIGATFPMVWTMIKGWFTKAEAAVVTPPAPAPAPTDSTK